MTYDKAKKLKKGDTVNYICGRNKPTISHRVIEIEDDAEHKDVFVKCDDGKLYHHAALR